MMQEEYTEENEGYIRKMIELPEGIVISIYDIETIEKTFRIKESNYGNDGVIPQYGIIINKDMEPSIRYPRVNIEIWFNSEEIRDQRFTNIVTTLKNAGYKFIKV